MFEMKTELKKTEYPDPLKLHLGCYNRYLPGYINVDVRSDTAADLIDDFRYLTKFDDESVDAIYVCHALEHVSFKESIEVLQTWYRKMKPGGIVYISVPDIMASAKWLVKTGNLSAVRTMFWGSQTNAFDFTMLVGISNH